MCEWHLLAPRRVGPHYKPSLDTCSPEWRTSELDSTLREDHFQPTSLGVFGWRLGKNVDVNQIHPDSAIHHNNTGWRHKYVWNALDMFWFPISEPFTCLWMDISGYELRCFARRKRWGRGDRCLLLLFLAFFHPRRTRFQVDQKDFWRA